MTAMPAISKSRLLNYEQQIDSIIQSMTLEEKIAMLHG